MGKPSSAQDLKSFVRKILLASPDFPRLYADVVIAYRPNSFEAKILAQSYEQIVAYTERTKLMSNLKSCTHIKVSGVRCGSPPLRGEQFCYFHQRMLRTVKDPASRIHHHALLEDEESIQASLMEVVNALLRGTIELKRAELILRALNTAVRNIRRVHFGLHSDDMVREIPDYPTPPLEQIDEEAAVAVARATKRAAAERAAYLAAPPVAPVNVAIVNAGSVNAGSVNAATAAPKVLCGDGSSTRPGGPELPRRSAPPPKPTPTRPAEVTARKPSASVKQALTSAKTQAPAHARKEAPRSSKIEAPKERKNAAHSLPWAQPKGRKPWVSTTNKEEQAPKGRKKHAAMAERS